MSALVGSTQAYLSDAIDGATTATKYDEQEQAEREALDVVRLDLFEIFQLVLDIGCSTSTNDMLQVERRTLH